MGQAQARKTELRRSLAPTAAPGADFPPPVTGARGALARTALLEAAIRLFCRHGITATGIDAIIARAGVARVTLYKHFGSKDGLVAAALEMEGAAWRAWFFARMALVEGAPRDRLLAIFDLLADWFVRDDYFGCALMNAIAEHRNQKPAIRSITQAHKRPIIEYIRGLCAAANVQDAKVLADQIDLLVDGAIIKALVVRNPQPAREARMIAEALLVTALRSRCDS